MAGLFCPVASDVSKALSFHGATGVSVTVWDGPYAALSNIPLGSDSLPLFLFALFPRLHGGC